jgi:hypothetical protein
VELFKCGAFTPPGIPHLANHDTDSGKGLQRSRNEAISIKGIVQISPKYRGSFNTLAFGEIKPHSGSLKDGRLDLVYHQNPGLNIGDPFWLWTLH